MQELKHKNLSNLNMKFDTRQREAQNTLEKALIEAQTIKEYDKAIALKLSELERLKQSN